MNKTKKYSGSKLRFLSQDNSLFCQALEKGSKFDVSP